MPYNINAPTHSLYIHWPFCPYKCHFCPFVAYAGQDSAMGKYHNALTQEMRSFCQETEKKHRVDTIFFGGGTPSTYPDNLLLDISGILKSNFVICDDAEITIEVNPGTVRDEQLVIWKDIGINRLSVGVQSLNDNVLKGLNRHQSASDVVHLLDRTEKLFENVSIDLIIGLPGISTQEWKSLIHEVGSWNIKHISIYFLTVHEGTALYFRVKKNDVVLPADDGIVDLYIWTVDALSSYGFEQYEISNFGKTGFRSRHNQIYWQRKPYKGFGVGACSFDGEYRFQNNKNLFAYMSAIEANSELLELEECLTAEQHRLEKLMLGLRQTQGISVYELTHELETIEPILNELKQAGYVEQQENCIRLTPAGLAVENEIIMRLSR